MKIDVRAEHQELTGLFDETEAMLNWPDDVLFTVEENRSGWSPAEHLHHVWLSSSRSLHAVAVLRRGHAAVTEEGEPNEAGRTVLEREWFPRGRMQAPENVRPPEDVDRALLEETLARGRAKLDEVEALLADLPGLPGRLPHPRLGVLNAREWMRFIRVHFAHHVAIIGEITGPGPDA